MKKLFIFLFLAGSVSVVGCGPKAEQATEEPAQTETSAQAEEAAEQETAEPAEAPEQKTAETESVTEPVVEENSTAVSDEIRTERVRFEKGAQSATVEASIKGYETVDYLLNAQKGQYMNVSMATQSGACYFNILAPGENEVAMFNGSTNGNQYEGVLSVGGDYKIRVYQMRSAARRNEVANYRLEMIVSSQ